MKLSVSQRTALDNLHRKLRGDDVDWISIADARSLCDLGLAERNRAGWNITSAGERWLREQAPPGELGREPASRADPAEPPAPFPGK